jgi:hypothetical protein
MQPAPWWILLALAPAGFASPSPSATCVLALDQGDATPDALIKSGREKLAAGEAEAALADFVRAAELDGNTPKSRVWVARGWIAVGRVEDALGAADELQRAGAPKADVDYLNGLGLLGMAKISAASGGDAYTQSQFEDAYSALQRALAADAARYSDAWLAAAEAGWYAQDLPGARKAAEKAVAAEPSRAEAHSMLGEIAFSQYVGAPEAEKDGHWKAALAAFEKAVALLGNPEAPARRAALAKAHGRIGDLHGWKQDAKAASASYASAIAWDPSVVDLGRVKQVLGEAFGPCLEDGTKRFVARYGEKDARLATVSWWSGLAAFEAGKFPESEAAFRRAVALWPAYANSWYYVFRAAASQQEYAKAIEALRTYHKVEPDGLVASLSGDPTMNVSVISGVIAWCADGEKHQGEVLNEDAAFLCEVLTRLEPRNARHWNNLGLFVRDQGDALKRAKRKEADPEVLQGLWKRAYEAYARSLELAPDDPNYLNDTAVMLHYYLRTDLDRAQEMYAKSAKRAEEELARKDLSAEDRAVIGIAKRDSNDNLRRLAKYREKLAAGEDVDPNSIR